MRNMMRALFVCAVAVMLSGVASAQDKPVSTDKLVNLNTATVEQLDELPGIGRATAQRILEYRQKNGGFKKIEEILETSRSARCSLEKWRSAGTQPIARSLRKSQEISHRFESGGRSGGRFGNSPGGSSCR